MRTGLARAVPARRWISPVVFTSLFPPPHPHPSPPPPSMRPPPLPLAEPGPRVAGATAGPPRRTAIAGGTTPAAAPAVASAPAARVAPPPASPAISPEDVAPLKEAITLARNGKTGPVTDLQKNLADPLARKLV